MLLANLLAHELVHPFFLGAAACRLYAGDYERHLVECCVLMEPNWSSGKCLNEAASWRSRSCVCEVLGCVVREED